MKLFSRRYRHEETTAITLDPSFSCALLQKDLKTGGEARVFKVPEHPYIQVVQEHFNASWFLWQEMRRTKREQRTVPFRFIQPSRVTGPLDMAEIGHLSQVTPRVAQVQNILYFLFKNE
jgi:hypothetical protein